MFWSKKSKAEKNYGDAAAPVKAKAVGAKAVKAAKPAKAVKAKKEVATVVAPAAIAGASDAIIRPHITEKAGLLSQNNVYTFQVAMGANKPAIAKAIFGMYKVKPVKIAVINLPAKSIFTKGRWGTVSAVRKAMVTLKKGDKIDFV